MNVTALFAAKPTRQNARDDLASIRRRLFEARERAEKYRVQLEALKRDQRTLDAAAKRLGVALESCERVQ